MSWYMRAVPWLFDPFVQYTPKISKSTSLALRLKLSLFIAKLGPDRQAAQPRRARYGVSQLMGLLSTNRMKTKCQVEKEMEQRSRKALSALHIIFLLGLGPR